MLSFLHFGFGSGLVVGFVVRPDTPATPETRDPKVNPKPETKPETQNPKLNPKPRIWP